MNKIQLVSDIHLEFPWNKKFLSDHFFKNDAEILIIAGDFCPKGKRGQDHVQEFLDKVSGLYKLVIIINGNHDYYGEDAHSINKEKVKLRKNVINVNRHVIEYDGIRFICATLWGNPLPKEERYIANSLYDFSVIKNLTMDKFKSLNKQDSNFIEEQLKKSYDGNTVVVTHHLPSRYQIHPHYKDSLINGGFASSEERLFGYNMDYWVYGHTHTEYDKVIQGTRFMCNPLGYVGGVSGEYRHNSESYFLENTNYNEGLYFGFDKI